MVACRLIGISIKLDSFPWTAFVPGDGTYPELPIVRMVTRKMYQSTWVSLLASEHPPPCCLQIKPSLFDKYIQLN